MNNNKIRNISRIVIEDNSDFVSELSNNGGRYSFSKIYNRIENKNLFEVSYETSADFDFCPCCGRFGSHYDLDDNDEGYYTCGDFDEVTEEQLLNEIEKAENNEDYFIFME